VVDTKVSSDDEVDLLLTPLSGTRPGYVARKLRDLLEKDDRHTAARIAQSSSRVVAKIRFLTLIRDIVPLTGWWEQYFKGFDWLEQLEPENITLKEAMSCAGLEVEFFRYAALVGFIDRLMRANTWDEIDKLEKLARQLGPLTSDESTEQDETEQTESDRVEVSEPKLKDFQVLIEGFKDAMGVQHLTDINPPPSDKEQRAGAVEPEGIFLINLNRPAAQSLFDSRRTVKADAAHRVFDIDTEGITFAIIDGGIDATHAAFLRRSLLQRSDLNESDKASATKYEGEREKIAEADLERWSRVVQTYDFTILRDILASGGDPKAASPVNRDTIQRLVDDERNTKAFARLTLRVEDARDLDWEIVRPLIRIPHDKNYKRPGSDHGTHVAGILAADLPKPIDSRHALIGMCTRLALFDLRVFDAEGHGDEFAMLCAIEFVGWLNRDRTNPVVHGVNLSLALAHDVDSFACGQTPICEACNYLVGAGTVVVAAAGNTGFEGAAKQSLGTGYRAISITDPGNADGVITVGSTHRRDPHLYGVSFFSARGPTGDGRRKPDLLAPGEKITSTIRRGRSQRMDGTSMAAPHVSGAAALLMARNPELIGRPARIKEILMASATDLKREPSFQGAGLLDVLRALESV
jgi:subtilisin family serine protease